jgi:hypothetical protein
MAQVTFAQLLAGATPQQVLAIVLAIYQSNGFPTSSWQPAGVDATRSLAIATAISDLSANFIPTITQGGFTSLAAGLDNSNMQVLAQQIYNLLFNPANFTIGEITLTASASAGTYVIQPGELTATFADSGNTYTNTTGFTISPSSSTTKPFIATQAGAQYNDPNATDISLATPLGGVTLSNPAGTYTAVGHVGAGVGSVTPSGAPVGPHQVTVQIDATGSVADGTVSWSYSLDGSPYVAVGFVSSVSDIGGTGINITLTDNSGGTPFVIEDEYLFSAPGSWITQQGSNVESNQALATRCQNRWSSLSNIPTESYYELVVTSVPGVGSQVQGVIVFPDSEVNNIVNVVVVGPQGPLPPATIATIQAFLTPRAIGTDYPVVQSPGVHPTELSLTVTVTASLLTAAQAAVETAINAYFDQLPINPTVRLASITELVMLQTGVIDCTNVLLDSMAANLVLGSSSSFVVAELDTAQPNITWITQSG